MCQENREDVSKNKKILGKHKSLRIINKFFHIPITFYSEISDILFFFFKEFVSYRKHSKMKENQKEGSLLNISDSSSSCTKYYYVINQVLYLPL